MFLRISANPDGLVSMVTDTNVPKRVLMNAVFFFLSQPPLWRKDFCRVYVHAM